MQGCCGQLQPCVSLGFSGQVKSPYQQLSGFDPTRHLAWGDIAMDDSKPPKLLKVHLKRSKTDQLGKGVDVFIGHTGGPLCPVEAITAHVSTRGSVSGIFFRFANQDPLTKARFVSSVRQAMMAVGLPYNHFAGHSFQIGAATAAARAGLEDSTIRVLGRWNSAAFLSYIRTPREHLAQYSQTISQV